MWALVTELLFSLVLLAFLVISCQNVLHIASGSVRSVLTYVHKQLDHELGEAEGVADEEENVTTRVVRRRVILKVQQARTPGSARPGRPGRGRDFLSLRRVHQRSVTSVCRVASCMRLLALLDVAITAAAANRTE